MHKVINLTHADIQVLAENLHQDIKDIFFGSNRLVKLYPVPRGGIPVAYYLMSFGNYSISATPEDADVIVDDIIDSGATLKKYENAYPNKPFVALLSQSRPKEFMDAWINFPWEINNSNSSEGIQDNVRRLLQFIGEDADRGGLLETPARVEKAWKQWTSGYNVDPKTILKVFEDGGEKYDQMVMVKDIPIYSKCEHHLADIFGTATIAYIPNGKIVGLSKLSRLADIFARRLQVQERLTQQIADALQEHLQPLGVGVIIKARHMCMESRGLCQQGHHTVTVAFHGALKDDVSARAEFMSLASQ
jgi:GTP cyclohydrolase I